MFLRLSWVLMAAIVGAHVFMAVSYATPDPCRAVGVMAGGEYTGTVAARFGVGGGDTVATAVEARLRQEGLLTCYGALGRAWYEGGVIPMLASEYGISARDGGS